MKENPSRSYWKEREEQARKERAKREKGYQEEQQQKFIKKLDDLGLTIKKDAKEIL